MHRWIRGRGGLLAAVVAVALVLAACAGGGEGEDSTGGSSEQAAAAPAAPIAITLKDFSITPAALDAPAGQSLTFDVTNEGPAPHTFAVQAGGKTYDTGNIDANGSATLEVPALEAGTYDVLCTVPGHPDLGMAGTLTTGGGSSAASAAGSTGGVPMGDAAMAGMDSSQMSAKEMAELHSEAVAAFPAETEGFGNQPLKPKVVDGVKVFELTATEVEWEVAPGEMKSGMAFNGQIPGPELRVHEGDRIRVVVQNQMSQPTVVHFHGVTVPNSMDGVPFITQDPIMPGDYYEYEFAVRDQPGTYVYHSHFNSTEQVGRGLFGAFIVEPKGEPDWDREYTVFTDDGPLGYGLNAKSFPATAPLAAEPGDTVLIRLANDGAIIHPMHLHGYHFRVIAADGFALQHPYYADTLMIAPGQRFDVLVNARYPGVWAFHCHILPHVEGPEGMFGMVTALVVQ